MPRLHHVVLFTMRNGASVAEAVRVLEASRPPSGVSSWSVRESEDTRKGRVIAEVAVFDSVEDFEVFRASDAHRTAGEYLAEVSDWVVADWLE